MPQSTTTTTVPATPTPVTGTGTYTTTCSNSVTADISELVWEVSGTTIAPVVAGSTVSLTGQTWKVTVPASVLQTGINLGLLHAGDSPAGSAKVSVFATNTQQGTVKADPVAVVIGPIALGGDGQALPASTSFAVPDMKWTAVGGTVAFSMSAADIDVSIGPLVITFSCTPKAPIATIVSAGVTGLTNIPPAAQVLGTESTRSTEADTLARTGAAFGIPIAGGVGLLDMGYLFLTASKPLRRKSRSSGRTTH